MKVLILGGTGVISSQIVQEGLKNGFEIITFNRGFKKKESNDQIKVIIGDRKNEADFADKMKDIEVDTVIDMICFNKENAKQTLDVFKDKAKQIIFTSSVAAYERPYKSYPVREDKESLSTFTDFEYAFDKAEMERYLQQEMGKIKAAITVVRPSLTFGEGSANLGILRQNRNLVRRIKAGKPVVMTGEGFTPWSFTFTPDLAKGYILCCGNEKTYNDHFQITNTERVVWEDLYKAIGKVVGVEPKLVYIPSKLLGELWPSVCSHLYYEKMDFSVFSVEKFQKAAPQYQPEVSLEQGIKSVIEWWETNNFPYDEEKEILEDQICAYYEEFKEKLLTLKR